MIFHRKKHAITPYSSDNNKITPSNGSVITTTSNKQLPTKDTNIDILDSLRNSQQITNESYIIISLLRDILLTLGKIQTNTQASAVSTTLLGQEVIQRFKWL